MAKKCFICNRISTGKTGGENTCSGCATKYSEYLVFFAKKCAICGQKAPFKIANKNYLCVNCFKKCGFNDFSTLKSMTPEAIHNKISENHESFQLLNSFVATKKVGQHIEFDDNNKLWCIPGFFKKIYNYSDIVDFELLENGESIATKTKGGLGRAVAGGLLFGATGAIVGGVTGTKKSESTNICTSLKIKITLKNINDPVTYVQFIPSNDLESYETKFSMAQECMSIFQLICDNQKEIGNNDSTATFSVPDEILKYKNLFDSGIISQEEFDEKKKQLLGL